MICDQCRERHHEDCPGGTWCDCQHEPPVAAETAETGKTGKTGETTATTEPALSWIRQE
jgi:hypothetical protein